jgi:hypothetical protein
VILFPDRYYKRSLKQGIGALIPSLFPIPHSSFQQPTPSPIATLQQPTCRPHNSRTRLGTI